MMRRLLLPLLCVSALFSGCDKEKASTTAAIRDIVEEINTPRPTEAMVGNYRIELAPGETGRGGLVILAVSDDTITLRGQYEKAGNGANTRILIPEQTVLVAREEGQLHVPLVGRFFWEPGKEQDTATFSWDGTNLPVLRSAKQPERFIQPLRKVSAADAAISTAPIVTGFEPTPAKPTKK